MAVAVLEAELLYLLLAHGAFFPTVLGSLIAADVDIFRREDVQKLVKHILKELEGAFLAHAEDVLADSPAFTDLVWPAGAAQLGIRTHGSHHMAGKVDLRNHGYAPFGGVCHHFTELVLGVVTAVTDAVGGFAVIGDLGTAPP